MAGGHALMSSPRLLLLGGPSPGGPHRGGRDLRPPTELREAEPELEILINEQLVLQEPEFSQCGFRMNWIIDSGRNGSVIPGFWITPLKEVVAQSA